MLERNDKSKLDHWEYCQTPEFKGELIPAALWSDSNQERDYTGESGVYWMSGAYVRENWFNGGSVALAPTLHEYIQSHMLTDQGVYLSIVQTNTGEFRLFAKNDQIIGSRFLAVLDKDAANQYLKANERD